MMISTREISLRVLLLTLIISGLAVADRPSSRRLYRRSDFLNTASGRYMHSVAFRRSMRHQRSTLNGISQRSARAREYAAHVRLIQAQRLMILQRMRNSQEKPWWGQWTTWSACGRTCGSGVQFQERHCLSPRNVPTRKRGKIICSGSTRKYRICSTEPCPQSLPSFRKLQCSQLASKSVRGKYYSWKPYGHPDDEIVSSEPCQLVCVSTMKEEQRTKKALDGTECRKGWNHGRCVNGKCLFIGCDGKINSTKLRDKCGNCGEENQVSCTVVNQDFSHSFHVPGEVEVVRIPEDSYDILILGKRRFTSDIVLKDRNGTVLFTGGVGISSFESGPRNVFIAGVEFRYRQANKLLFSTSATYLLTSGPLRQEIFLHVGMNVPGEASLHYEFKVPIDPLTKPESTSTSDNSYNSPEAVDITPTVRRPVVPTISVMSAAPRVTTRVRKVVFQSQIVPESNYPASEHIDEESFLVIREFEPIDISQEDTDIDNNSTDGDINAVGEDDLSTFIKPKFNDTFVDELFIAEVDSDEIGNDIAAVESLERILNPDETVRGKVAPVITGASGPDGIISGRIGNGYEVIQSGRASPPLGIRESESPSEQPDSYSWRSTGFAPCSSTCTIGFQDSYTRCERTRTKDIVDDQFCDPRTRPEPVRKSCKSKPCTPRWEATPWSQCSKSCGIGQKSRTVRCWKMISAGFDSTIYNELCANVSSEKPTEAQPCKERDHCGPLWETSDWSSCRSPCDGFGTKERLVRCSAGDDDLCAGTIKPHAIERCKGNRCLMKWIVSDWGECSGACGGGRKTRKIMCFDNESRRYPEFRCDGATKPETSHPCGDRNCHPEWITQDWGECSAECGKGVKKRLVLCSGIIDGRVHHYNDSTPCNATSKPEDTLSCQVRECDPVWLSTPWSQCSVTCGSGRRVRQIRCYRNGSPASGCDATIQPIGSEPCQGPPCPKATGGVCRDKPSVNCALVRRVNLCSHWYYQTACCTSCRALRRGV